jgi:hypothetical protein
MPVCSSKTYNQWAQGKANLEPIIMGFSHKANQPHNGGNNYDQI